MNGRTMASRLSTPRRCLWPPPSRLVYVQQQRRMTTHYAPLYVSATRQHVGKTTTSLALLSGLLERFAPRRVGFMKPVGQQSVLVDVASGRRVDKDAALVQQYFTDLAHWPVQYTSPVLIPPGTTREALDGQRSQTTTVKEQILNAFSYIQASSDILLCEGTGHVAVGSIIDASNADVASWIGAHMILVANGGIGSAFDELELNRTLCQKRGVPIAGVIINKVRPDKYEQTKHYLTKALRQKWNDDDIPLLACIPDRPFLGCPALADLQRLFDAQLVSGQEHRLRHYRIPDLTLVATSLEVFLKQLRHNRLHKQRTLYVCHASRNDILLGYLMESIHRHQQRPPLLQHSSTTTTLSNPVEPPITTMDAFDSAMIVTGCADYPLSPQVREIVTGLSAAAAPPVLLTPQRTDVVMQGLYQAPTPKLNREDAHRVERAVEHYRPYIDFDILLERLALPTTREASAATCVPEALS